MNIQTISKNQNAEKLTDAFHIFNELSQNLSQSYQGLEQQVAKLHKELTFARSERVATLIEKEKLASRLQKILATLPAGVVVLDTAGIIIDCNAKAIEFLGEPLKGCHWIDVLDRSLIAVINNPHERQLRNGNRVSITQSLLDDSNGQIILLSDVSEMRLLQDLVHQQKHLSAMGEMVASMAHQLRTPISTAMLYASQFSNPAVSQNQQQLYANKILERMQYLERQINDMLIFAKQGKMNMESFSLPDMLQKISELMQDSAHKAISFDITSTATSKCLMGNETALRGALMNLIENAVAAVALNGVVSLTVSQDSAHVLFKVKDNGAGIDAKHQERIFEPFFTTRVSGTGLGLAVVNSVIQAHHGKVECASEVGAGTCFSLYLPIENQHFEPLISSSTAAIKQECKHEAI